MNRNHLRAALAALLLLAAAVAPAQALETTVTKPGDGTLRFHLDATGEPAESYWQASVDGRAIYSTATVIDLCVAGRGSGSQLTRRLTATEDGPLVDDSRGSTYVSFLSSGTCPDALTLGWSLHEPSLSELVAPPLPVVETPAAPEAPAAPATPEVDAPPVQETPVLGAPTILPPGPLPVEVVEAPTAGYMGSAVVA